MADTKRKGDIGEAMVLADCLKRGYKVAIPYGEDWDYDLIVDRGHGLERVQVKYAESDGKVIKVKCQSTNNWHTKTYTECMIDWIAVYDHATGNCYYIRSSFLGEGRSYINLRLEETTARNQHETHYASDFLEF